MADRFTHTCYAEQPELLSHDGWQHGLEEILRQAGVCAEPPKNTKSLILIMLCSLGQAVGIREIKPKEKLWFAFSISSCQFSFLHCNINLWWMAEEEEREGASSCPFLLGFPAMSSPWPGPESPASQQHLVGEPLNSSFQSKTRWCWAPRTLPAHPCQGIFFPFTSSCLILPLPPSHSLSQRVCRSEGILLLRFLFFNSWKFHNLQ